jgi:hypothetical protein
VRDGGEDIGAVSSRSLNTVSDGQQDSTQVYAKDLPVVDTPLAGLVVDVKVLQVVVEINTAGTEVSTEQGSVRGEDGRDVDMPLSAEGDSETGLPFVEVGDDGGLGLSARELVVSWVQGVGSQRQKGEEHESKCGTEVRGGRVDEGLQADGSDCRERGCGRRCLQQR